MTSVNRDRDAEFYIFRALGLPLDGDLDPEGNRVTVFKLNDVEFFAPRHSASRS